MTNLLINIGLRDCDGRTYTAPSVLAEVLVFLQDCIVPETRCISRVAQSETEPTLCVALTVHDTRWHRASIEAALEKLCFPLHQEAIAYVIRAEDGQPEGHIVGPHAALWLPFDHSKFLSP